MKPFSEFIQSSSQYDIVEVEVVASVVVDGKGEVEGLIVVVVFT